MENTNSKSISSSDNSNDDVVVSSNNSNVGPLPPPSNIPDPITSNVPGTWSYDTMSRRIDAEILQRTYEDNKETWENQPEFKAILARFTKLRKDLQQASTTPLHYPDKPPPQQDDSYLTLTQQNQLLRRDKEWQEWKDILQPFVENEDTWLTAPWMVTEFYVYRTLLIDVIKYWDEYEYIKVDYLNDYDDDDEYDPTTNFCF